MKEELSAVELWYLVQEWGQTLLGGRIQKVFQPSKQEIQLHMHCSKIGRKILRILVPKFMYLTTTKGDMPTEPSGFCMSLRKHLEGTKVDSIELVGFERVVRINCLAKEDHIQLIVEMIPPGNILLCKDDKILMALEHQEWKTRTIKPGKPYTAPTREWDPRNLQATDLKKIIGENDADVLKVLATTLGLGKRYAHEVLARAQIAEDRKTLDAKEIQKLHEFIESLFSSPITAQIVKKEEEVMDITPFPLQAHGQLEKTTAESYNEALNAVLTKHVETTKELKEQKVKSGKKEKIQSVIDAQKNYLGNIEKEIELNSTMGNKIYEHYAQVKEILTKFKELHKKKDWQEIKKELLKNPLVKEVKEKEGKIIIEVE